MTFTIKQHDTRVALEATLSTEKGAVDLTDADVKFIMSGYRYNALINRLAEIKDATNGVVWFVFENGDTAEAGNFKAEFEVTFSDGRIETFPNDGYLQINIMRGLG